jgi:hypothetical protein
MKGIGKRPGRRFERFDYRNKERLYDADERLN